MNYSDPTFDARLRRLNEASDTRFVRGLVNGLIFSVPLWAVIGVMLWWAL